MGSRSTLSQAQKVYALVNGFLKECYGVGLD